MPYLGDLTESSEILARYGGNLTRSSKISLDPMRSPGSSKIYSKINYFGWIFPLWIVSTELNTFQSESNRSNPAPSSISSTSKLPPPDSVGSIASWTETRSGPIHVHPQSHSNDHSYITTCMYSHKYTIQIRWPITHMVTICLGINYVQISVP